MAQALFKIQGMSCDHCVQTLQSVLTQVPGVKEAEVSLKDHQATLSYEGKLEAKAVLDAVAEAGYEATLSETRA
jgi:copper chaperone CopZ